MCLHVHLHTYRLNTCDIELSKMKYSMQQENSIYTKLVIVIARKYWSDYLGPCLVSLAPCAEHTCTVWQILAESRDSILLEKRSHSSWCVMENFKACSILQSFWRQVISCIFHFLAFSTNDICIKREIGFLQAFSPFSNCCSGSCSCNALFQKILSSDG